MFISHTFPSYPILVFCLLSFAILSSQSVVIDNTIPRIDDEGKIIDAHDGRLIQFGNTFYWYGTSYGITNGFTTANHYVCYSSKDLKNWKKEGKLLPDQPEGMYYRPHVIYNRKTKKYVLWYNWYPKLWEGQFGVATSKSPQGPFKIVNDNVRMFRSDVGLGDFGLFVDDDQTAYISYNTIQNHQVSIEKLEDDYLSSTQENGGIISEHMEAGSQFKRNEKYYLLTDYTCCFCNYGSGARVYISDHPLKGYTLTTNINRYPGRYSPMLTDGTKRGTQYETLSKNETNFESIIVQLDDVAQIDEMQIDVFTGNRPENCGNVENPRVHPKIGIPEFEIFQWNYDQWKPVAITNKTISSSALRASFALEFKMTATSRLKIVPKSNHPYDQMYLNEISVFKRSKRITETAFKAYVQGDAIPKKPIIPAQQTYIMKLSTKQGNRYVWMGDLWGSASDDVKGHDYQYWSAPLQFNEDGTIQPLSWTDTWQVNLD